MKAKVNLRLLSTTTFDSGGLGLLAMVLHQFRAAGKYQTVVMQQGRVVTDLDFEVDEKSPVMQLDLDLAEAVRRAKVRPADCDCWKEEQAARVVSPEGYVLFHASSGEGYSAAVSNKENAVDFNSATLREGDLFAISLLEPATYSMRNRMGNAAGEIIVTITPETTKDIRNLETRYIEVNEQEFNPPRMELTSSQGLVFRVTGAARILIKKKDTGLGKPEEPLIRWQKYSTDKK